MIESDARNVFQAAYQILVASDETKLAADTGDKWDSGRIDSDRSVAVEYDGAGLTSGERRWWKVRLWDQEGRASEFSRQAWFEMGLLKDSD